MGLLGYNLYIGDDRLYSRHVMPILHKLWRAEESHILGVKAAYWGVIPRIRDDPAIKPYLRTKVWDVEFDNPVGLAAGFDKDGEAVVNLSRLGFGFVEAGSTTPKPQQGNFFPRVFRLTNDRAIINRYGFNSLGHEKMLANLNQQAAGIHERNVKVGVNLGKNKLTTHLSQDYVEGLNKFYGLDTVAYFVINISSPNTPGLRQSQRREELLKLLDDVLQTKAKLEKENSNQKRKPLLLKLAPDLSDEEVNDISSLVMKYSKPAKDRSSIDGLVLTNTTIKRPPTLRSPPSLCQELGGLSGAPLKEMSVEMVRKFYKATKGTIPIIGVGGIENGHDAFQMILAGASMVQFYTAMAYYVSWIKVLTNLAK